MTSERTEGRPFKARGSRVKRCELCQMPADHCICHYRHAISSRVTFWLLMHRKEQFKPTNTGRLIEDIIADCRRSIWDRTQPPLELIEAIQRGDKRFMVLFPEDPARDMKPSRELLEQDNKKDICIIIPDGTWRQASRMMNRSPYLDALPRIGLWQDIQSQYRLRKPVESHHLCTAEVAVEVLKGFELDGPGNQLMHYFDKFNLHYALARRGLPVEK